jgi:hypothetical protein
VSTIINIRTLRVKSLINNTEIKWEFITDILRATVNLEAYEDGLPLQPITVIPESPQWVFNTIISLKDSQQHPFHGYLHIPAVLLEKKKKHAISIFDCR